MTTADQTREPQYQVQVAIRDTEGLASLGLASNQMWRDDPRHLLFTLSRAKFIAKMLSGKDRVLEVGCGDAFGSRLVQQEIKQLCAVDFDEVFVNDAKSRMAPRWKFECRTHDILSGPVEDAAFDAAYSMDVIEHIQARDEETFVRNIVRSLKPHGTLIVGTPSLQSQVYASESSKAGHVNCKDAPGWKALLQKFFHHVFMFSMNDEVVHTGYYPMAHYLFAVCAEQK